MLLICFYCLDFNVFTIHPPRGPFILQWGEVPPTPVIRSPEAYAVIWTNRPGPPRTCVDLDLEERGRVSVLGISLIRCYRVL